MSQRYAVYWLPPPASALARLGAAWLGCDSWRAEDCDRMAGPDDVMAPELVADAARYGFHATLVPPARLVPGQDATGFATAVSDLAAALAPFSFALRLDEVRGFPALVCTTPEAETALGRLAAGLMRGLVHYRAVVLEDEIRRRDRPGLDRAERAMLHAHGYPWLFETFRFHLTLAAPPAPALRRRLTDWLAQAFAPILGVPLALNDVVVTEQISPGGRFRVHSCHALRDMAATQRFVKHPCN